jgi:hypothetical protein
VNGILNCPFGRQCLGLLQYVLHCRILTMYVDKPMKGHGLMQAIARVNRVFRDKPAGLVVDYIGIAQNLKSAC